MINKVRKSRRDRPCFSHCRDLIKKGDLYTEITIFPHEEPYVSDVPHTAHFCSKCMPIKEQHGSSNS